MTQFAPKAFAAALARPDPFTAEWVGLKQKHLLLPHISHNEVLLHHYLELINK